ncbi:hypothetical protein ACJRO7_025719 [Eucalyptus globulus]|uniref:Flotillin-like n=1 Tax=Eucalyptus globulus TaxID=34317 RepID=A0ABD3KBW7_EUCGL
MIGLKFLLHKKCFSSLWVQAANWELYKKQRPADAVLYENVKKADTQKAATDTTSYTHQQVEKAKLLAKIKKAKGIQALAQAEDEYLVMLMKQFGATMEE